MSRRSNYFRGLLGEIWTAICLILKGYRPLKWRYKTPVGEIDLVMVRGDIITFIEVKYRHNLTTALQSIPMKNRRRIIKAVQWYLNDSGDHRQPRVDMVAVNRWGKIRHIQNAWDTDGY
jgi:putative endonuclease